MTPAWPLPPQTRVVEAHDRYRLLATIPPNGLGIQCAACGLVSWNPRDVDARYCGRCHRRHEEPEDDAEHATDPV